VSEVDKQRAIAAATVDFALSDVSTKRTTQEQRAAMIDAVANTYDSLRANVAARTDLSALNKQMVDVAISRQFQGVQTAISRTPATNNPVDEQYTLNQAIKAALSLTSSLTNSQFAKAIFDAKVEDVIAQVSKIGNQMNETAIKNAITKAYNEAQQITIANDTVKTTPVRSINLAVTRVTPEPVVNLSVQDISNLISLVPAKTVKTTSITEEKARISITVGDITTKLADHLDTAPSVTSLLSDEQVNKIATDIVTRAVERTIKGIESQND
jgi:hypothetical protein